MFDNIINQVNSEIKKQSKPYIAYRKDFDTKAGSIIGAGAGLAIGAALENSWVNPEDSIKTRLFKKLIAKGGSIATGTITGGYIGNRYGNNKKINDFYAKIARALANRHTGAWAENKYNIK